MSTWPYMSERPQNAAETYAYDHAGISGLIRYRAEAALAKSIAVEREAREAQR